MGVPYFRKPPCGGFRGLKRNPRSKVRNPDTRNDKPETTVVSKAVCLGFQASLGASALCRVVDVDEPCTVRLLGACIGIV